MAVSIFHMQMFDQEDSGKSVCIYRRLQQNKIKQLMFWGITIIGLSIHC